MYNTTAKGLAALGRNGDNTLMHVGKNELAGLQRLLGPLSNNPDTGLPEAFAWGPIMGIIGGVGMGAVDLGLGGAMHEPVKKVMTGLLGDTVGEAAGIVAPAVTTGLLNAGVNYAMGGKKAALGGFAQGAMMGGLGALDSDKLLGIDGTAQPQPKANLMTDKSLGYGDMGNDPASLLTDKSLGYGDMGSDISPATSPGFFDQVGSNLGKLKDKYGSLAGFKSLASDYGSPAFLSAMVSQGLTQEEEDQQRAAEAQNYGAYSNYLNQQRAGNIARATYGYAAGGPVTIEGQGGYPVSITIPGNQVEELSEMGGMAGLMQHLRGMAHGGYIDTTPMPADPYPQSQIPKATPYPAASPQRHEVVGYAGGGSPSSSSFNTTFEAIPTESGRSPIVDVSGRKIAVANISGKTVPFYVSTGGGGKASVPAGKWYPYFGHGPDGWFNKSSEAEIGRYYDSPALKQVAEHLDNTLGDMRHETHFNGQKIPNVSTGSVATQFINQGLNPQPHTFQGSPDDLRGTAQWYKDLESNIKNTVSQVHDAVTRGPTNTPSMLPPAVAPAATQGAKYSVPASLREAVNKYGPTLAKGAGTALNVVGNAAMLLEPDSGREAPDADKPQDYPGEGFNPYYADVPSEAYDKAKWIRTPSGQLMNLTPSFAEGGFLDGPGDGQSDSIPASIEGKEPIKVADGEFVVPKHIVDMIGVDALDKLLSTVRKNSYGTDQQIPQDAGKLAAERLLARYA